MAGEIITATTLPEAKKELQEIYKAKSTDFEEITREQYEALEHDERPDSDNHLNAEKLGKEADIIDLAYYKYLPDRQVAYRVILKHKDGDSIETYFSIIPNLA